MRGYVENEHGRCDSCGDSATEKNFLQYRNDGAGAGYCTSCAKDYDREYDLEVARSEENGHSGKSKLIERDDTEFDDMSDNVDEQVEAHEKGNSAPRTNPDRSSNLDRVVDPRL